MNFSSLVTLWSHIGSWREVLSWPAPFLSDASWELGCFSDAVRWCLICPPLPWRMLGGLTQPWPLNAMACLCKEHIWTLRPSEFFRRKLWEILSSLFLREVKNIFKIIFLFWTAALWLELEEVAVLRLTGLGKNPCFISKMEMILQ